MKETLTITELKNKCIDLKKNVVSMIWKPDLKYLKDIQRPVYRVPEFFSMFFIPRTHGDDPFCFPHRARRSALILALLIGHKA